MILSTPKTYLLLLLVILGGCKGKQETPSQAKESGVKKVAQDLDKKGEVKASQTPSTDPSTSSSKGSDLTEEMLVGTWKGVCYPSNGSFAQLTFRMTKSDWDLDYIVYGDKDCSEKAKFMAVNIQGPYTLGEKSKAGENAREGTFAFSKKTVTAAQEAAVGFLKKTCQFKEVKVGKAIDLTAGCSGLGAYPLAQCAQDYDLVMVKGDLLHFGKRPKDNNMCTADKRPSTFEGGAVVKKQ